MINHSNLIKTFIAAAEASADEPMEAETSAEPAPAETSEAPAPTETPVGEAGDAPPAAAPQ